MQNHRPRQRYAVSLYSERIVSGKIIPIPRSNGTRRPCLTKFSSIRFERDRRFNKLIDRGANVWLNFNSWEICVMNLRVKSIEIVNFLNPLYNRYRSYVSSWKLISNYAREGKERLKYWWKRKKKRIIQDARVFFSFSNFLFRLTTVSSKTLVIVLYSTCEICLATLHLLPFQRWNGKDSVDGKFQSRNRAMTRVLSGWIDRRTVESDLPWWPWCSPVNHLATLTPLTVTRSISL